MKKLLSLILCLLLCLPVLATAETVDAVPELYTVDFGTFTMNLGANDYYETAEEMVNGMVYAIIYPNYDPAAATFDNINIVWSQADATAEVQSTGPEAYAKLVLDVAKPQFEAMGIPKVITKVNHLSFGSLLSKVGVECVITPHVIAADHILRYVRAMQNSVGSNVSALVRIANQKAEALELYVRDNFSGKNVALRDLRLKKGLLIACIIRKGQVIFPNGSDSIQVGDSVIVVTTDTGLDELNDVLL